MNQASKGTIWVKINKLLFLRYIRKYFITKYVENRSKSVVHITLNVEDKQFIPISQVKDVYDIWQASFKKYECSIFDRKLCIQHKLYGIHSYGGLISSYIDSIIDTVRLLRGSRMLLDYEELKAVTYLKHIPYLSLHLKTDMKQT